MTTPGRPTARCLREDLPSEWTSVEDQRSVADLTSAGKLHELGHPIVRKAAEDFPPGGDSEVKRESISGLKDPVWWKVKTGSRWRGAAYDDPNGQAWLVAAGYRREGEGSDFYKQFMADVGASGPGKFLPTAEDLQLLRDELDDSRFVEWEIYLQGLAHELVENARQNQLAEATMLDPDGDGLAQVLVSYTREELGEDPGDVVVDIYIEFCCLEWKQAELLQWAESVVITAIDPREQSWATTGVNGRTGYSQILDEQGANQLLLTLESPGPPGISVAGIEAHYAPRDHLVESTIEGRAVRALCGKCFVPRQDHEKLPPCDACQAIHAGLPG